MLVDAETDKELWQCSVPLGDDTTSNAAEYCGLIGGLRRARRWLQMMHEFHLTVIGDSKLIVDQVNGLNEVRDEKLRMYHAVAVGLLSQFASHTVKHVPREQNQYADALANEALGTNYGEHSAIFYPNLTSISRVTWQHGWGETFASNDILGSRSDGLNFIDAKYLTTIHPHGIGVLENLQDPGTRSVCNGKVAMNVLGVLVEPITAQVKAQMLADDTNNTSAQTQEFRFDRATMVVMDLPVPLHLHFSQQAMEQMGPHQFGARSTQLAAEIFPAEYRSHPYWHSNVIFMPLLD